MTATGHAPDAAAPHSPGRVRRGARVARAAVVFAVLAAALVVAPRAAFAAACCTSAGLDGAGRLLVWEKASLALSTAWTSTRGRWDEATAWQPLPDGDREAELRAELRGMLRVTRRDAAWLTAPWVHGARRAGDLHETGAWAGDITLGWRHQAIEIGELLRAPGLAVLASVVTPAGRATEDARTTLGADVTTRGAWQLRAGAQLEWSVMPWFVQVDFGGGYHLPGAVDGARRRFGPNMALGATGGAEVVRDVVVAAGLAASHERRLRLDGEPIDDSQQSDLRASLSASWRFHSHWTLQLGASSGLLVDGLGDNRPGTVSATAGLRYGVF